MKEAFARNKNRSQIQTGSQFSFKPVFKIFFTEKPLDCVGKGIPNTAIGNVMCMPFPVGTPHVAQEWYILQGHSWQRVKKYTNI